MTAAPADTEMRRPPRLISMRRFAQDALIRCKDRLGFGAQSANSLIAFNSSRVAQPVRVSVGFVPKTKIEIAVDDALVDLVIEAITKSAQTGKVGDGKIFVFELAQVVRIRTGERDASAI